MKRESALPFGLLPALLMAPAASALLGRPAVEIRLTDVVRAFQGPVRLHDCVFKESVCPDVRTCPLRKTLARLEARRLDPGTRNSTFCSSPWKSPTSLETGGEKPPFQANGPI